MRWLLALLLTAGCASVPDSVPRPAHGAHAWVRFDARGVVASGAEGMADRAAGRALTIDDPVRIASISKLVVALGVMRLVEQGALDLDRDVSDYLGWTLRNPAYPDTRVTLRLLLSHRSSLQDEVDYALPLDKTVRAALADPKAFDAAHAPGDYFRYSNLNFPVIATAMERATGERFDRLMDRLVIRPLSLNACYNWPSCDHATLARAAILYGADGAVLRDDLGGKQPDCPVVAAADGSCDWRGYRPGGNGALFSPQGGLRISARGLSTVGRLLLNQGRHEGAQFLKPDSIAEMTRLHWRFDGSNGETDETGETALGFYCGYALAVQVLAQCRPGDDPFGDGKQRVGHAGSAYGVRSGLWIDPATGAGIAYFATGVAEDAPPGASAYRLVEEWLAKRATR